MEIIEMTEPFIESIPDEPVEGRELMAGIQDEASVCNV